MKKLRLVQERRNESATATDVRGFGDPDLFQRSGTTVHLMIASLTDEKEVAGLCDAYHLVAEACHVEKFSWHLTVKEPRPGEHATEALRLFVAAIEISKKASEVRCLIFQTSGLRGLLRERMKGEKDGQAEELMTLLADGARRSAKICMHASVANAVHQAGLFETATKSEWVQLADAQIGAAHSKLVGESGAKKQGHKKAAEGAGQ